MGKHSPLPFRGEVRERGEKEGAISPLPIGERARVRGLS
jgi:hypothetical protein